MGKGSRGFQPLQRNLCASFPLNTVGRYCVAPRSRALGYVRTYPVHDVHPCNARIADVCVPFTPARTTVFILSRPLGHRPSYARIHWSSDYLPLCARLLALSLRPCTMRRGSHRFALDCQHAGIYCPCESARTIADRSLSTRPFSGSAIRSYVRRVTPAIGTLA